MHACFFVTVSRACKMQYHEFDCLIKEMLFIYKFQPTLNDKLTPLALNCLLKERFCCFGSFVPMLIFEALTDIFYVPHNLKVNLDNGVTIMPKRQLFTVIFACLCVSKSLLIKNDIIIAE